MKAKTRKGLICIIAVLMAISTLSMFMFVSATNNGSSGPEFLIGLREAPDAPTNNIVGIRLSLNVSSITNNTTLNLNDTAFEIGDGTAAHPIVAITPGAVTAAGDKLSNILSDSAYKSTEAINPANRAGFRFNDVKNYPGNTTAVSGAFTTPYDAYGPATGRMTFATTYITSGRIPFEIVLGPGAFAGSPSTESAWTAIIDNINKSKDTEFGVPPIIIIGDDGVERQLYEAITNVEAVRQGNIGTTYTDDDLYSNDALSSTTSNPWDGTATDKNGLYLWGGSNNDLGGLDTAPGAAWANNHSNINPNLQSMMNSGAKVVVSVEVANVRGTNPANNTMQLRLVSVRDKFNYRPSTDSATNGLRNANLVNVAVPAATANNTVFKFEFDNKDIWNSATEEFIWDKFYIEKWSVGTAGTGKSTNTALFEIVKWSITAVGGEVLSGGTGGGSTGGGYNSVTELIAAGKVTEADALKILEYCAGV